MSDNEQNTKKRISVLDIVIILVIIAGIVGVVLRFNVVSNFISKQKKENVLISFVAEGLTANQADSISDGSTAYCNGKQFGTVKDASQSIDDSAYCVRGTVSAVLTHTEDGAFRFDGDFIGAGSVYRLRIGNAEVDITVLSVSFSEN